MFAWTESDHRNTLKTIKYKSKQKEMANEILDKIFVSVFALISYMAMKLVFAVISD
jgi:hypothetical protein